MLFHSICYFYSISRLCCSEIKYFMGNITMISWMIRLLITIIRSKYISNPGCTRYQNTLWHHLYLNLMLFKNKNRIIHIDCLKSHIKQDYSILMQNHIRVKSNADTFLWKFIPVTCNRMMKQMMLKLRYYNFIKPLRFYTIKLLFIYHLINYIFELFQ